MSTENSGVFTLKEINRVKIIQEVIDIGKYIDVYHYPDSRKELRLKQESQNRTMTET